jgi:polyferredoxin
MNAFVRHFVLGIIIGMLSIIMLFVMFNSVVDSSTNSVQSGNAYLIILIYGLVTAVFGLFIDRFNTKYKKKR